MNKKSVLACRYVLAIILYMFGFNEFHNLLPIEMNSSPELMNFINSLKETGFLYYSVKGIEFVVATLFVAGVIVPIANLFLLPVVTVIFLSHLFLYPQGLFISSIMLGCSLWIAYSYREMFSIIFDSKTGRIEELTEYNVKEGTVIVKD